MRIAVRAGKLASKHSVNQVKGCSSADCAASTLSSLSRTELGFYDKLSKLLGEQKGSLLIWMASVESGVMEMGDVIWIRGHWCTFSHSLPWKELTVLHRNSKCTEWKRHCWVFSLSSAQLANQSVKWAGVKWVSMSDCRLLENYR